MYKNDCRRFAIICVHQTGFYLPFVEDYQLMVWMVHTILICMCKHTAHETGNDFFDIH